MPQRADVFRFSSSMLYPGFYFCLFSLPSASPVFHALKFSCKQFAVTVLKFHQSFIRMNHIPEFQQADRVCMREDSRRINYT